jgi:hypothetical protein
VLVDTDDAGIAASNSANVAVRKRVCASSRAAPRS